MPLEGEYEPCTIDWVRDQVELYERTAGAQGATNPEGLPVVVLTTLGARSGKLRKTPVMRVEHDGEYAVVASLGGAPNNPSWYHNAVADPHVELQDGGTKRDMLARQVAGEEKARWWARCVRAFPDYGAYQRTTTREIPVLVVSPVE